MNGHRPHPAITETLEHTVWATCLALGLIYGTQYQRWNIVFSLLVVLFVVIYVFFDPRYRKLRRAAR